MICPKCGRRVENDATFCSRCGEPIPCNMNEKESFLIPPDVDDTAKIQKHKNNIILFLLIIIVILCVIIAFLAMSHFENPEPSPVPAPIVNKKEAEIKEPEEEIPTKYITNFVMKKRTTPTYNGKENGFVEKGETIKIYGIENSNNGSVWGQLKDDTWICLEDNDESYCKKIN